MKLIPFILLLTIGCSSPSKVFDSQNDYSQNLRNNTQTDKKYSGLSNTYQVSVTHLNNKVLSLKNKKLSFLQQWPSHKVEEASQNQESRLSKNTVFIVLLFTPISKHNDLSKGSNSIWRSYLEVNNQRYPGIATITSLKPTQLKTLVPNMTRFSKAYEVSFPIPAYESEASGLIKFILTSDLGTSELNFQN